MKTNRQKCIDMWQWIVDHDEMFINYIDGINIKLSWAEKNQDQSKEVDDFHLCFACLECGNKCIECPVNWVPCFDKQHFRSCLYSESDYLSWERNPTKQNAEAVLKVIKGTWKE